MFRNFFRGIFFLLALQSSVHSEMDIQLYIYIFADLVSGQWLRWTMNGIPFDWNRLEYRLKYVSIIVHLPSTANFAPIFPVQYFAISEFVCSCRIVNLGRAFSILSRTFYAPNKWIVCPQFHWYVAPIRISIYTIRIFPFGRMCETQYSCPLPSAQWQYNQSLMLLFFLFFSSW